MFVFMAMVVVLQLIHMSKFIKLYNLNMYGRYTTTVKMQFLKMTIWIITVAIETRKNGF